MPFVFAVVSDRWIFITILASGHKLSLIWVIYSYSEQLKQLEPGKHFFIFFIT